MDSFNQGLLSLMSQPAFQIGTGLLGRTHLPFGQALGGTMADMNAYQAQQQRQKALQEEMRLRQQAVARQQQEQQYMAQAHPEIANAPQWYQQSRLDAMLNPPQRRIVKGADGFNYFEDGSRVLPGVSQAPPGPDVKGESALRDEFVKLTKEFATRNDAYGNILAAASTPSAAGDMALIFSYMKMLDPNSTVREGEYATAQNAGGIPDRILGMYNAAINGKSLAENVRSDFVNRAGIMYNQARETYKKREGKYRSIAKSYGFDPQRAVPSRDLFAPYSPAPTVDHVTTEPKADSPVRYDAQGRPYRLGADGKYHKEG